jgi:hypothetical protein
VSGIVRAVRAERADVVLRSSAPRAPKSRPKRMTRLHLAAQIYGASTSDQWDSLKELIILCGEDPDEVVEVTG